MRWTVALGAGLLGVLPGAIAVASHGEVTSILTKSAQDVEGSLPDLNEEVAKGGDPLDWRDLGIAQCRLGNYRDAAKSLSRATSLRDEDFYLAAYYGLTLQGLGRGAEAAPWYDRAAGFDTKARGDLEARAGLLRAQSVVAAVDAEDGFPDAAKCVAVLPAVDLGGNAEQWQAALGTGVAAALASRPEASVLWPADVVAWLAGDDRSPADLEDDGRKDRVASAMARRGVDLILTTSFLLTDTGEMHLRLVLFPVSAEGLGAAQSLTADVGQAGAECAPLATAVTEVWTALGISPGTTSADSVIPSLAGTRDGHDALTALRDGRFGPAQEGMCAASGRHPEVGMLRDWCGVLRQIQAAGGEATLTRASDPDALIEVLRAIANSSKKKERRFDDF